MINKQISRWEHFFHLLFFLLWLIGGRQFGLLVSMSSSMKTFHELRIGSIFFSTVLGMWRSTCFPNKIVINYYQSWKYCPTNKFVCSWKLLQIWYVTHKDILILSLLSSDSIEKQLHQDFNNGFGFFCLALLFDREWLCHRGQGAPDIGGAEKGGSR